MTLIEAGALVLIVIMIFLQDWPPCWCRPRPSR